MTTEDAGLCVATFHATYAVLKVEKLLKELGIAVRLIPVPRQISSNCGISLRFECAHLAAVMQVVLPLHEDLEGVFRQDTDGRYHRLETRPLSLD